MSNELERFPQFAIDSVDDKGCVGTFDCDLVVGNDVWGYLMDMGNFSIEGKFYDFDKTQNGQYLFLR